LLSTYVVRIVVLALVLVGDTPAFAAGFEEMIADRSTRHEGCGCDGLQRHYGGR
jgi:hypothetical protein